MTPTLIFWIRIGIIATALWALWNIIKAVRKQQKPLPHTPEEWKRLLPELLFLGVVVFLFFWIDKTFQRQIDAVISAKNKPLKDLYFTNMQTGRPDSLAAYKGKVVILNIWATWCGPCRSELPDLDKLQTTYQNELVVLALSDERESTIRNFLQTNKLDMTAGAYKHYPLLDSLNSRPVSILIGKNNEVKDVVVGARGYGFFRKWVEPFLQNSK